MAKAKSGPTRAVCELVDSRDFRMCVRCGRSLASTAGSRHHRQGRRGHNHEASNLILLCGSGTTGCHGWVHGHPREARARGWIVSVYGDPSGVPVYRGYFRDWVSLDDAGKATVMPQDQAQATLKRIGVLE